MTVLWACQQRTLRRSTAVFLLGGMMMVALNLLPMLVRDIRQLE
nr:hypothetical protein [Ktedonobacteraceae bacterium]